MSEQTDGLTHSQVSPFLFDLRLRFRLRLCLSLNVQQTLEHNSGWMTMHSQDSPCLRWCFRNQTRFARSSWWILVHPLVYPFWIIGFWLDSLGVFATSSDFWIQFFHPINFERNLWRMSRWHIYILVNDCSTLHHNNFRDTVSWECVMKDDNITSCHKSSRILEFSTSRFHSLSFSYCSSCLAITITSKPSSWVSLANELLQVDRFDVAARKSGPG